MAGVPQPDQEQGDGAPQEEAKLSALGYMPPLFEADELEGASESDGDGEGEAWVMALLCAGCGTGNALGSRACRQCGARLAVQGHEAAFPTQGRPPPISRPAEDTGAAVGSAGVGSCAHCSTPASRPGQAFCEECGKKLH